MSKAKEIVLEMARLTMLSNKLNDVQLTNLKMYPFIYFENIMQVTVDYDLSNQMSMNTEENSKDVEIDYTISGSTNHLHVSYYLEFQKGMKQAHLENRYAALEQSVRGLLWKDVVVKIYFEGVIVYESKK